MEVTKYRAINKGSLLGVMNITLPSQLILNDIKVIQSNGSRWVGAPSREYEKDGEKKHFPFFAFNTPEAKKAFNSAALKALDEYCKNNPIQEEQQQGLPF